MSSLAYNCFLSIAPVIWNSWIFLFFWMKNRGYVQGKEDEEVLNIEHSSTDMLVQGCLTGVPQAGTSLQGVNVQSHRSLPCDHSSPPTCCCSDSRGPKGRKPWQTKPNKLAAYTAMLARWWVGQNGLCRASRGGGKGGWACPCNGSSRGLTWQESQEITRSVDPITYIPQAVQHVAPKQPWGWKDLCYFNWPCNFPRGDWHNTSIIVIIWNGTGEKNTRT